MLGRHQFAQRLRRKMRGAVLSNVASRGRSATDASIHQIDPVAVLVPEDSLDLEAALELASEMQVPVLPRGAGSSRCGQTVGEALVIDFSRHFNKVLRLDRVAATVEVEPGVVLDQLNAVLRGHG
jgi:FAD/FMN-containing dehydrogenase